MDHGRSVFTANGEIQAQQIRAFLEAAGISSELRGESLRNTHDIHVHSLPDDRPRIAGLAPDSELGWTPVVATSGKNHHANVTFNGRTTVV